MKIDKKLIVSVLELYKAGIMEKVDVSKHDEILETIIKVNLQIKLIKEWKKQIKCLIGGYIIAS